MATEIETQTFLETYVIGHYLSILHHARISITLRPPIVRKWRHVPARSSYIPSRRSLADCFASSELLGLLMVALRPPATLLGFLSPSLLPADSNLPESRTYRGQRIPIRVGIKKTYLAAVLLGLLRGVGVVDVCLVATGDLSVCRHVVWCDGLWLKVKRVGVVGQMCWKRLCC